MKVKLKYFVQSLQGKAGKKEEVIEVGQNDLRVSDILDILEEKHGEGFRYALRNPHLTILLNNENIRWKENFNTPLNKEYSQLVFLYTPGGG